MGKLFSRISLAGRQTGVVRFAVEHRFRRPPEAVAAVLADPEFYTGLELPDVAPPVVLDHRDDGTFVRIRLRYQFVGGLDPVALRLIGSDRLSWLQDIEVDLSGSGRLTFAAEADARRLHGWADFTLARGGGGSVRRLTGELIVAVPAVGSWAERRILPGLLRRLDIEAEAVDSRLEN